MAGAEAVFRATSQMAHDYSHTDPKTGHKLMGKSTDREEGRLEGVRWREEEGVWRKEKRKEKGGKRFFHL